MLNIACALTQRRMFKPLTLEEGKFLVKLARKAIEEYLKTGRKIAPPPDTPEKLLKEKYGVFTTLELYLGPDRTELRGCIGFPQGLDNVVKALIESAIAAATEDPRFEPLRLDELNRIVIEVSVLSPLQELKVESPKEYLNKIVIGRHGLVVKRGIFSGLLLPQVPVEYCWDVMTFLNETCAKAFLPYNCWLDELTTIYIFEAQVFKEVEPNGEVIERDLVREYEERCKGRSSPAYGVQ